ncbi:MAG: hypothetical protein OEM59_08360 [Rhodospirillales bacterium]|nr:hypothetical protein [Rhodospirillales bacterium]
MSEGLERTGAEAGGNAEVEALVHRFWLTFIRTLAEPHLAALEQGQADEIADPLMERRLAENIDKAVEAALSGRPPHRCGSFGRAALTLLRSRHGADDGAPWLADGEDPAPPAGPASLA